MKCKMCKVELDRYSKLISRTEKYPFTVYRCPECGKIWEHNHTTNHVQRIIVIEN